jgi:hypothetical protein
MDNFTLQDGSSDPDKEILQSNFNSNNTVKQIDFAGDVTSNISSSQISKIRQELQFP